MSKFFKDNKIARAHQAKATCGLEKFTIAYVHQNMWKVISLLINYLQEKSITESQDRQIFIAHYL